MEPDTLAVVAILSLLIVSAVILGFLLYGRRNRASRRARERDPKN